jgi:hypothetical protein
MGQFKFITEELLPDDSDPLPTNEFSEDLQQT